MALGWAAVLGYFAVAGLLAFSASRPNRSLAQYAVAGDLPAVIVGLSLAAQLTSVATFVVNPGLVYAYGLSALLGYGVAAGTGILLGLAILSRRFRSHGTRVQAITVPQWIGARYDAPGLRIAFAVLSLALVTFSTLIVVGLALADLVLAFRLIRKQPVLTLTAVLALATGIGLATTGFAFLESAWRARLPFDGGDRFVMIDVFAEPEARRTSATTARVEALRGGVSALQHLGALENAGQNLLLPSGEVALVAGIALTPDSFAVLPYPPLLGRTLRASDAARGAPPVVVIRESLWRRHFSSQPSAIGQLANFSGVSREIVGVMPDTLEFPNSPEVWLPLLDTGRARLFGVLATTGGLGLAQQQLAAVSQQFESARPDEPRLRLRVLGFIEAQSQGVDILATAVVFVLVLVLIVIAANVANLVLARTLARSSELAVRSALGATRSRLVAQVFTEVLVLGIVAAAIGVFASRQTLRWVEALMTDMPFWVNFEVGPRTALFVAGATVLTAAVGGAWPALRATRRDTMQALATSNRRVAAGLGLAGSAMIAMQVALSIAALYAALVVARGVSGYMEGARMPGEHQIVTARLYVPERDAAEDTPRSSDPAAMVLEAVRRMPGIVDAGLATSLPRLSPRAVMTSVRRDASSRASEPRSAPVVAISPGFVTTLGARPTAGRDFTVHDGRPKAPRVALVNQPFVDRFFGGASPLGQHVRVLDSDTLDDSAGWHEIVGVVPDLGLSVGDTQLSGGVYLPLGDEPLTYLVASVTGDPTTSARLLSGVIAAADPRVQVREVLRLPDVGSEDRAVFAAIGGALTSLGAMALVLSVIGVYAMLSFAVTARTREIAIRSALGATRAQLLRTVLGRASVPLAIGLLLGPALGSVLVTARGIFAFRLPADAGPLAIPSLIVVFALAAMLAAFTPARRALRITMAEALKE